MVNDLYKRTNMLVAQFRCLDGNGTIYKLFKSFCMSLYGFQLLDFSKTYMEELYVAWRKCVRKILGVSYRTHSALLPYLIDDLCIQSQMEKRLVGFIHSLILSNNNFVKVCFKLVVDGSTSPLGKSTNWLLRKYNWDRLNLPSKPIMINTIYQLNQRDDDDISRTASQIKELMVMRDSESFTFLNLTEIKQIMDHLCMS